jgi:murein DD-endopeptidase MepM/ murein hydrolase activator NlpD
MRSRRRTITILAYTLGLLGLISAPPADAAAPAWKSMRTAAVDAVAAPTAVDRYVAPLVGNLVVVRAFQAPLTVYGAGHRGVDLSSATDHAVRAAAAGTVSFAGQVAGRGVIVITHPDGVETEYEPVSSQVRRGDQVAAGQTIGQVSGIHGSCPIDGCLHWGAQRGATYFDPMSLLNPLGVVHLVKWEP